MDVYWARVIRACVAAPSSECHRPVRAKCARLKKSGGICAGCERAKGTGLRPDLAQGEGVSLHCPTLSSGSLQLVFHSACCQIPVS